MYQIQVTINARKQSTIKAILDAAEDFDFEIFQYPEENGFGGRKLKTIEFGSTSSALLQGFADEHNGRNTSFSRVFVG